MTGYRVPADAPVEMGRPLWGYSRVPVESVCRLWSAYREGLLRTADLRTWFAAHELLARRCNLRRGRVPRFTVTEVSSVSSLSISLSKASIRRLTRLGFLTWSNTGIQPLCGTEATVVALTGLPLMLAAVTNPRRVLPIPRHTVLMLARSRRPVLIATILGQLFRCIYYRSRTCVSWGRCKASWVADAFGVDVRNVKAARKELETCGWMRQVTSNHWQRQRFGAAFVITLQWESRQDRRLHAPVISPLRKAQKAAKSPPPVSYKDLPFGNEDQNRVSAHRTGVCGEGSGKGEPRLLHVVPADLVNPERTAALFRQAVSDGLVKDVPMERLRFFAAAERAKRLAHNPGGFFVTLLRRQLWKHISDRDEEPARRVLVRMPEFFYGMSPPARDSRRGKTVNAPELIGATEEDRAAVRVAVRRLLDQATGRTDVGINRRIAARSSSGSTGTMRGVQPKFEAFDAAFPS
jgi:hypothetical protein